MYVNPIVDIDKLRRAPLPDNWHPHMYYTPQRSKLSEAVLRFLVKQETETKLRAMKGEDTFLKTVKRYVYSWTVGTAVTAGLFMAVRSSGMQAASYLKRMRIAPAFSIMMVANLPLSMYYVESKMHDDQIKVMYNLSDEEYDLIQNVHSQGLAGNNSLKAIIVIWAMVFAAYYAYTRNASLSPMTRMLRARFAGHIAGFLAVGGIAAMYTTAFGRASIKARDAYLMDVPHHPSAVAAAERYTSANLRFWGSEDGPTDEQKTAVFNYYKRNPVARKHDFLTGCKDEDRYIPDIGLVHDRDFVYPH
ncbi:MAG: hypothetical protein MHM6MM_002919 [Cercozoa sp. M6MM]